MVRQWHSQALRSRSGRQCRGLVFPHDDDDRPGAHVRRQAYVRLRRGLGDGHGRRRLLAGRLASRRRRSAARGRGSRSMVDVEATADTASAYGPGRRRAGDGAPSNRCNFGLPGSRWSRRWSGKRSYPNGVCRHEPADVGHCASVRSRIRTLLRHFPTVHGTVHQAARARERPQTTSCRLVRSSASSASPASWGYWPRADVAFETRCEAKRTLRHRCSSAQVPAWRRTW